MNAPARCVALALLVLPLACFVSCKDEKPQAAPQPASDSLNVLLITLDTTRADRLGCYGYEEAKTPALDALASSGTRFAQAFTSVPLTLPAHTTLLTGVQPPVHQVRVNGAVALGEEIPTLAEKFKQHGYQTGAFVSAFVLAQTFGLNRGFDVYDDETTFGGEEGHAERRADQVCDAALRWLETNPERAFFAWVHFFDPHHPYEPPAPFDSELDDPYDGEIAFMDAQLARLVDWLRTNGLTEQTLVIAVGDHGESFGEHEELQHGVFVYDATMHVPLIFALPSRVPAGKVIGGNAELIDLVPTVLDLLGWDVPEDLAGRSLVEGWTSETWEFWPCYGESEYVKYSFGWAPLKSLTTEEWKYIQTPKPELYDRDLDPGELKNVLEQHPDVARELEDELDRLVLAMKPRAAQAVTLNDKARKRLQSLGYLSGGKAPAVADDANRRDAKDMIDIATAVMKARTVAAWGDHARVVAMVEPLTRRSPESDCLYEVLGPSYIALGRYAEAEEAFKKSMRTMASRVDLLCGLGVSYFHRGMLKDATQVFDEALRADPDHAPTHNKLGAIYAQTGRFELAWKHFSRGLELEPDSPSALSNVANLHMQQRRPQEAAKLLTKALEIDPGCAMAHWGLWQAMRMSGISRAEVVGILRSCLQARPDDPIVLSRLAWALATDSRASSDNVDEALRLALEAVKTAPKNAEVVDALAACYAAARRFPEAVQAARQALTLANAQRNAPLARQISARLQRYQSEQRYTE